MEVRICHSQKNKGLIKKLELPINPTFKDLFTNDLCKKVLIWYWEEMVKKNNLFLFGKDSSPQKKLKNLLNQSPELKQKEAIYLSGLYSLTRDTGGIRNFRQILSKHFSNRSWFRVGADIKKLDELNQTNLHGWVKQIEDSLTQFTPYIAENINLNCKE